ncbi:hypothetical protein AB1Y20_005645 [Prymnesium parvum]|uniref:F-box domain-containing protein n=1 Tax=Prymnesium parvum TaxID=97485 RepID=A0AB34J4W8_PRYPA
MGAAPSSRREALLDVERYLHEHDLAPPAGSHASGPIDQLLASGAVAVRCEQTLRAANRRETRRPAASSAPPAVLHAVLRLDPRLELARYRCVPSVAHESVWWEEYLRCLREAAAAALPRLLREAEARARLEEWRARPPVAAGALAPLTASLLLELAKALPDARALLELGATSRGLYPLAHHPQPWALLFQRDFPDIAATLAAPSSADRKLYMDVATGRVGRAPAGVVWLADRLLAAEWGDATLSYGGWGAPHLKVSVLRRGGSWIVVEAEFEYAFDDGETVWGGRVAEELVVDVDHVRREWSDARAVHGEYRGLMRLREELAAADDVDPGGAGAVARASCGVELASLDSCCRAV